MAKEQNKYLYVSFSNKQVYNERTMKIGDEEITRVSIKLPSSSQYKGYSIERNKDSVYPSKFSDKSSYIIVKADSELTLTKYDKETGKTDSVKISATELKNEFSSWKKDKSVDAKSLDEGKTEPDDPEI